jgi:hypothetical protein
LGILSEFTQGQGEYMDGQLSTAVELRNIDKRTRRNFGVLTAIDVVRVIQDLLRLLDVSFCCTHLDYNADILTIPRRTKKMFCR